MKATGGTVNPKKTFWWLVDFQWRNGCWKLKTQAQNPAVLLTKDKFGQTQTVPRKEINQEQRILGAYLAPKSSSKAQAKALRTKVTDWASAVRQTKMNPEHAWVAITTRIQKGIEWPLVACTLTRKQCDYITAPLLRWGLRAAGVNSRIDQKITHASTAVLGLGLRNLYTSMGIARLTHLASHAHKCSMTGELIRATFQSLQLETGLPGNLFDWEHEEWKHVITKTWASECWKWASDNRVGVLSKTKQLVPTCLGRISERR